MISARNVSCPAAVTVDGQRAREIEHAGVNDGAFRDHFRIALAGQQRPVDFAAARDDDAIGGQALARRDQHFHLRLERRCGQDAGAAVGLFDHGA